MWQGDCVARKQAVHVTTTKRTRIKREGCPRKARQISIAAKMGAQDGIQRFTLLNPMPVCRIVPGQQV
jgi:hypothetical protein